MSTIQTIRTINVRLSNGAGILQTRTPITLKNQIQDLDELAELNDVAVVDRTDGSTLVYNSETEKYTVQKLTAEDLEGNIDLDGGEY